MPDNDLITGGIDLFTGEQSTSPSGADLGGLLGASSSSTSTNPFPFQSSEEVLSQRPPVPVSEMPFLQAVHSKIAQGVLGTPIPQILVSAGMGAMIGAGAGAPVGGIGALPGAAVGAVVGAVADIFGASADVAVQKALPGGIETPIGTISPELAGLMTGTAVGVIGGTAGLRRAIGGVSAMMGAGTKKAVEAQLGGMSIESIIPRGQQMELFPQLAPSDPVRYSKDFAGQLKIINRAFHKVGVPYDWDVTFESLSPQQIEDFAKQGLRWLTPSTGTDYSLVPGTKLLNKLLPVEEWRRGGDVTADTFWKRLARIFAPPHRMATGDRSAEMFVGHLASAEGLGRAYASHMYDQFEEIWKGIAPTEREFSKNLWLKMQGTLPKADAEVNKLPLFDEAPRMTRQLKMAEVDGLMREQFQRSGKEHLIPRWEQTSAILNEHFDYMKGIGVLTEEDRIANYLSRIRMKYAAESPQLIELPNGYFPAALENMIPKEARAFYTMARRLDSPPKDMSFEDIWKVYSGAMAHVLVNTATFPRLQALLPQVKDPNVASYLGNLFNYFIGRPGYGAEAVNHQIINTIKNAEFMRVIGGSLLTPMVNSFQSLNMLAYSGGKWGSGFANWTRGLLRNPSLDARLEQLGYVGKDILQSGGMIDTGDMWYNSLNRGMRNLSNFLGMPFQWSENFVRKHAFRTATYAAKNAGMEDAMAERYALYAMDRTNFVSRVGRTPLFMKNDLGSIIGQFKTYMVNQAGFLDSQLRVNPAGAGRFIAGALLMLGTDGVAPGLDIRATRQLFGKPEKLPYGMSKGVVGGVGLALSEMANIYGINADDIKRLMQYLPGPAIDHVQSIAGALTGVNFGKGLDFENTMTPLTPDQRASMITRSIPFAGSELNRLRIIAKLVKSGDVERGSQDLWQAFGIDPSKGPITRQLGRSESMMRLFGLTSQRVHEQEQFEDTARNVSEEYKMTIGRVSELTATGRLDQANKLMDRFKRKYPETMYFFPSMQGLQGATERLVLPQAWREIQKLPLPLRLPYYQQIMSREIAIRR